MQEGGHNIPGREQFQKSRSTEEKIERRNANTTINFSYGHTTLMLKKTILIPVFLVPTLH